MAEGSPTTSALEPRICTSTTKPEWSPENSGGCAFRDFLSKKLLNTVDLSWGIFFSFALEQRDSSANTCASTEISRARLASWRGAPADGCASPELLFEVRPPTDVEQRVRRVELRHLFPFLLSVRVSPACGAVFAETIVSQRRRKWFHAFGLAQPEMDVRFYPAPPANVGSCSLPPDPSCLSPLDYYHSNKVNNTRASSRTDTYHISPVSSLSLSFLFSFPETTRFQTRIWGSFRGRRLRS